MDEHVGVLSTVELPDLGDLERDSDVVDVFPDDVAYLFTTFGWFVVHALWAKKLVLAQVGNKEQSSR